jgi:hypothetical protein
MIKPRLKIKTPLFACILLSCLLAVNACTPRHFERLDINHLSGKIIGVMNGYSADYILYKAYKDVELRRFDAYSDMTLALAFHRLDAAALEMDEAYVFCRLQPEYMIYATLARDDRYAYLLNPGSAELNKQFNAFIAGFRQTGTYKDMLARVKDSAKQPFKAKKVEGQTTGNRVLRVLVYDAWEPVSYINTKTNEWEGVDIELITYFADSIGARIEFSPVGSYTQAVLDLGLGRQDLFVCPNSLRQKTDLEKASHVSMSECVWEKDIVIIVNSADYKNADKGTGAM